ncbi:hypothetical protein J6590_039665 [Homalodisca vitripennis]|nr:hypothetical protein J6590_039665 [Homalodisca vitripennis]
MRQEIPSITALLISHYTRYDATSYVHKIDHVTQVNLLTEPCIFGETREQKVLIEMRYPFLFRCGDGLGSEHNAPTFP